MKIKDVKRILDAAIVAGFGDDEFALLAIYGDRTDKIKLDTVVFYEGMSGLVVRFNGSVEES